MATESGGFDALLSAFDRFDETLDATTVPAEGGGGRVVGGIPHAVALSEATDALYGELGATYGRLIQQHGQPIADYYAGIVPKESDSLDGPWPGPGEVCVVRMGIGGNGADAMLLAALENANKVAAFPIGKWNEMQAARPGANHQRFHAGEVVSAADLSVLESAAKMLRMAAVSKQSGPPKGGGDNGAKPATPPGGDGEPAVKKSKDTRHVVLWEGAEPSERNIQLARTRSAYLEAHGNVAEGVAARAADGHRVSMSTFYNHLEALDVVDPHWRDRYLLSNPVGNLEKMHIARTRGKSRGNVR